MSADRSVAKGDFDGVVILLALLGCREIREDFGGVSEHRGAAIAAARLSPDGIS